MNNFWENRYKTGGNSGSGSYGENADHKGKVINDYIVKYGIKTISDFGCGDGNQISLLKGYENYYGFDISEYILTKCRERFIGVSMTFFDDILSLPEADLCMSLDVMYHIVDEKDYLFYLDQLFGKSKRFVLIFSSNFDGKEVVGNYIYHRKFTNWIEKYHADFKFVEEIPNFLQTAAQFYLYERIV